MKPPAVTIDAKDDNCAQEQMASATSAHNRYWLSLHQHTAMYRLRIFVALSCFIIYAYAISARREPTEMLNVPLRLTNTTEVSVNLNPTLSGDGRVVAFESNALLSGTGGAQGFRAFRATLDAAGTLFTELGLSRAVAPAVSQDGAHIAFASTDNPLGSNPDGNPEIFFYDGAQLLQVTDTTPGGPSQRLDNGNFQPSMTDDGRLIAFSSNRDLTGHNADANQEIFLYDSLAQQFSQLTDSSGIYGASMAKISGDGSRIAYVNDTGQTPSIVRDLVLYERQSGLTRIIAGHVNNLSLTNGRAISDDGLRVVYAAETAPDTTEIFLWDGRNEATRRLTTLGARAIDVPLYPTISGDGKRLAFATRRNVTGGNTDNSVELYTYDLPTALFARVTNAPATATAEVVPSMNDDGSLVAFSFPRVLSGAVSSNAYANNSEIYVAETDTRPPYSSALTVLNGASLGHEPDAVKAVAPDSIAQALGTVLAFSEIQAQPLPGGNYPTTLGGTSVSVNDRPAQILYVSPTRVTFHIPQMTGQGFAQIIVTNQEGFQTRGSVRVLRAAPGIFTLNGSGTGAGSIYDAKTGQPGPFDPTGGLQRLKIYATGARGLPQQVSVLAAGRVLALESINASAQSPGLDEMLVRLPADLRGAGTINLSVIVNHRESNPVTLTLTGDTGRDVFLNEVLADPPDGISGDANHDGVRSGTDDEFVELVNAQSDAVNISGWKIRTLSLTGTTETTRHTFAQGTIIPPRDALVVFGGGAFDPALAVFGGAQIFAASSGALSLTNTGLTIIIRDAAGNLITQFTYGGATGLDGNANQSLTRSPDISGNYALHSFAQGAGGRAFSPGTLVDGTSFVYRAGILSSVSLAPAEANSIAGQTIQLTARALDQFNRNMKNVRFTFAPDDERVATVESVRFDRRTGVATATVLCRDAGQTKLRATAGDGSREITSSPSTIFIAPAPPTIARVEISPEVAAVNRGSMQQFSATAFDADGQTIPGISFSWSSSDVAIASIDANGLARGAGAGSVTISATAANGTGGFVSGEATLAVNVPLLINEILADVPPDNPSTLSVEGDANRDGVRSTDDDEFVELLNNSDQPVDISGVIIADATTTRYTFPANTVLAAGRSALIFGGGAPPAGDPAFGGALVKTTGSLSLNDAGDTVNLRLNIGGTNVLLSAVTYGTGSPVPAPSDQSLTRSPDAEINTTGGDFVAHTNAVNAAARLFSPGTRTDGTPFGSLPLTRLELLPQSANINPGETQNFNARAYIFVDGQEIQLQNFSLIFDVSDASRAAIAPSTGTNTVAHALAPGSVNIRARAGGLETNATLNINAPPPVLTRIEVSPASAIIVPGGTQQFLARAFDQNDQEIPGLLFTWTARDENVATIWSDGVATGVGVGQTEINAGVGNIVSPPAVLSVSPPPATPVAGQVIINEALVSFATSTTQVRNDFIELLNTANQPLDISGLQITFRPGGSGNAPASVSLPGATGSGTILIPAGGYYLIVNGAETFNVAADFDASSFGFDLNNTTGGIKLELGGIKLDGLTYQGGTAAPAAPFNTYGEGAFLIFTGGTTNDLIRSPNGTDTGDNAHDFRRNGTAASVTPKAGNP